jgi:hypothetical protein
MAFALAIKSITDFAEVGSIFLFLTMVITAFTLIYSSLFLEITLYKCDIIVKEEEVRTEMNHVNLYKVNSYENPKILRNKNFFDNLKERMVIFNQEYLMPYVDRNNTSEVIGLKANLLQDFKYSKESK